MKFSKEEIKELMEIQVRADRYENMSQQTELLTAVNLILIMSFLSGKFMTPMTELLLGVTSMAGTVTSTAGILKLREKQKLKAMVIEKMNKKNEKY